MLAVMSNLASLADHVAAPAFNSDFYATVAATIPVLFLAMVLQGGGFQDLVQGFQRATAHFRADITRPGWRPVIACWIFFSGAMLILFYGAVGEIIALFALYHQHVSAVQAGAPLWSAVYLTVAVVIRPLVAIARGFVPGPPKEDEEEVHTEEGAP